MSPATVSYLSHETRVLLTHWGYITSIGYSDMATRIKISPAELTGALHGRGVKQGTLKRINRFVKRLKRKETNHENIG